MKVFWFVGAVVLIPFWFFFWDQSGTEAERFEGVHFDRQSSRVMNSRLRDEPTRSRAVKESVNYEDLITAENIEKWLLELESLEFGDKYKELLSRLAEFYGKHDPEAGKKWLLEIGNSPENLVAFSVFGNAYAEEFGVISLDFFDQIGHPSFAEAYLNSTTSRLSLDYPSESLTFVLEKSKNLKSPDYSFRTITSIAALNGFEKAFQLIRDHEASKQYMKPMISGIAFRIMSEEKWGASMSHFLAEVRRLERENLSLETVESVINATATSSFDELVDVISGLPKSKERDHGASLFAKRVVTKEPRSAVYWINQIGNPEVQIQTALTVLNSVEEFDPGLRKKLVNQLDLHPGGVERIRSHFEF